MIKTIKELERVINVLKKNFDELYRCKIKEVLNENGLIIFGHNENVRCPLGGTDAHLRIQYAEKFVYKRGFVDLTKLTETEIKELKILLTELTNEKLESIIQKRIEDETKEEKDNLIIIKFLHEIYEMIEGVAEMEFIIPFNLDGVIGKMGYANGVFTFYSTKGFVLFKRTGDFETFDEKDYEFVRRYGEDVLKALSENI